MWIQGLPAKFLVQGKGYITFLPAVTRLLSHHCSLDRGNCCSVDLQGRGDITVLPAVTALLLHHNAMGTGIDCSVFSKGRGDFTFCLL